MTEQEKAKELIEFFKPIVYSHVGSQFMTGTHNDGLILENAKRCALKVVQEIINSSPTSPNDLSYKECFSDHLDVSRYYWVEVEHQVEEYEE